MYFNIFSLAIIYILIQKSNSLNMKSLEMRQQQRQIQPAPLNLTELAANLPPELAGMTLLEFMMTVRGKGNVITQQSLGCKLGVFPATQCTITKCDFVNNGISNCGAADASTCPSYCFNCPVTCVVQQQTNGCPISAACPNPCC